MWLNGIEAKLNLKEYWPVVSIVVEDTLQRKLRYTLKGFEDFTVEVGDIPGGIKPVLHLNNLLTSNL